MNFANAAVDDKCKNQVVQNMTIKWRRDVLKAIGRGCGGHVQSGACGSLYADSMVRIETIQQADGGACGNFHASKIDASSYADLSRGCAQGGASVGYTPYAQQP